MKLPKLALHYKPKKNRRPFKESTRFEPNLIHGEEKRRKLYIYVHKEIEIKRHERNHDNYGYMAEKNNKCG
jgi:hypothetical protein